MDEEEKKIEESPASVGADIIISEPEGGKGNKYHKAKDGKFASPGKGEAASSEAEAESVEEVKKPSISDIISKYKPKPTISEIINKYKNGGNNNVVANPSDWNNIISLRHFNETREKIFRANKETNLNEIQIKNLENKINPIIRNAMLGCNFSFSYILDFIESNQILNQFSLGGKSGGYSSDPDDPDHGRARMSHNTFGSEGVYFDRGLSHEEVMKNRKALEKYGCLMDNNPYGAATNRIADYYGDAFWIMNDSVKNRTTFTIGDSLGGGGSSPSGPRTRNSIPMPIKEGFNYRQLGRYGNNFYNEVMNSSTKDVYSLTQALRCSYIEAQMHGDILINRDIFGCCAKPSNWDSPDGRKALKALNEMGVRTFTHRRGNNYLEEVILNPDGSFEYRKVE